MAGELQDLEAERAVLGAVLLDAGALRRAELDAEAFTAPQHRALWQAMARLAERGTAIDPITLEAELEPGAARAMGGVAYLGTLAVAVPTAANVEYYAAIVRDFARRRALVEGFAELAQAGRGGTSAEELEARGQELVRGRGAGGFASAAERVAGEAERRAALVARELRFHVTFLDDYLRGILPHDFVLLGAYTGAGKTELARLVAMTNAQQGRRVHYFALEAEPDEIERRCKFSILAQFAQHYELPGRERLNYPDWYRGRCDDIVGRASAEADKWIQGRLGTLYTFYQGLDFTAQSLEAKVRQLQRTSDLIVVDHLHYVDLDEDENENRAFKRLVKRLRQAALEVGVPVLAVAHLRKRDRGRGRRLLPEIDDFHGSSDLAKVVTKAILLSSASDQPSSCSWVANTYIQVVKDRQGGACPYVALAGFDLRRNSYEKGYLLGRARLAGDGVDLLADGDRYPRWAQQARSAPHQRE